MASINSRTRKRDGRKVTVYVAQVRVKGFKATAKQFDDKAEAKAWAEEQEAALKKLRKIGGVSAELPTLTVAQLIERFLADPETKQLKYHSDLTTLLAPWAERHGSMKVRAFGPLQIVDMRNHLLNGLISPARVNRYLSAMRRCWNWGIGLLIDRAQAWPRKIMLKEPRGRVRYLSDGELKSLLKAAEAHSQAIHAAIVVSLSTGIRQGELLRLTWRDLDPAKKRLTVLESKNSTPRTVHLPSSAASVLSALKRAPVVGSRVFLKPDGKPFDKDGLAYAWRCVRDEAELTDFRWHDLRHSCASYLAQNGASLLEIGSVLGHKSPSVTMRYSHLVEGKPVTGHDKLNEKLGGGS